MKNKINKLILIISVMLIGMMSAFAFSFRNMTLDFIHISDTHISTDRQDTPYKALGSSSLLLENAVKQINNIKGLDFVLFTGDLVDSATYENYFEYYRILSKLKYPTLNAFGNHDFSGNLTQEEVLDTVRKYNPNYIFDNSHYAFSPKTDFRIIVLDGTIKNVTTSNGEISAEQLQFLDNELAQNKDKVIVLALHFPPVEPFIAREHSILNANELNEILLKYKNPIIVLSGHYHAAKIRHYGNLVYVSTPSMVTYPMAFRHIKIVNYKNRVSYKFDFIETNLEKIKEANKQTVISNGILAGFEKDRNYDFIYNKKQHKSARYKRNKIKNATKQIKTSKREIKKLTNKKSKKKQTVTP